MKGNIFSRFSLGGKLLPIFVILVFTVTYAPLVVMMIYSFNSPGHSVQIESGYAHEYVRASEKWNGFSPVWYKRILSDKHLLRALVVSVIVTFTAVPVGPSQTQLALFPEDDAQLRRAAENTGLDLDGPHPAILVQCDDDLTELAKVHEQLYRASVNVYAATGITSGAGHFGYIVYVRPEQYAMAAEVLGLS